MEAGTCKLRADWDIHLTLNICAVYVRPLMWLLFTTVGPHETDLDYFRNWKVRVRSFMIPFHPRFRKLFCYWRKYKATYSCSLTHRDNSTKLKCFRKHSSIDSFFAAYMSHKGGSLSRDALTGRLLSQSCPVSRSSDCKGQIYDRNSFYSEKYQNRTHCGVKNDPTQSL